MIYADRWDCESFPITLKKRLIAPSRARVAEAIRMDCEVYLPGENLKHHCLASYQFPLAGMSPAEFEHLKELGGFYFRAASIDQGNSLYSGIVYDRQVPCTSPGKTETFQMMATVIEGMRQFRHVSRLAPEFPPELQELLRDESLKVKCGADRFVTPLVQATTGREQAIIPGVVGDEPNVLANNNYSIPLYFPWSDENRLHWDNELLTQIEGLNTLSQFMWPHLITFLKGKKLLRIRRRSDHWASSGYPIAKTGIKRAKIYDGKHEAIELCGPNVIFHIWRNGRWYWLVDCLCSGYSAILFTTYLDAVHFACQGDPKLSHHEQLNQVKHLREEAKLRGCWFPHNSKFEFAIEQAFYFSWVNYYRECIWT